MSPYMTAISPRAAKGQTTTYTGTAGGVTLPTVTGPDMGGAVWVVVTTDAFVRTGGTATSSDMYLPAFVPVVLAANPGDVVSAIQVSAAGSIFVMPLA